jgi:hypothetical protein
MKDQVPAAAAAIIEDQVRRVPLFSGSHETPVEVTPTAPTHHEEV